MTPQEKIAIFHAYNGCDCKHIGTGRFDPKKRNPKTRNAILTPSLIADFYEGTFNISEFVLLLTDLSLISDEHAVEVAKIAIGDEAKNPIIERKGGRVRVSMEYGVSRTICVISPCANQHEYGREYFYVYNETQCGMFGTSVFGTSKITDTLRAWNYNIGHGKYTAADLVNEGVVILNHENKGI